MSDYLCLSKEEVNKKFFEFIRLLKEEAIDCGCAGFVKRIDALAGDGLW